ncbi:MAG: hypothetical protein KKF62_11085 [Bacteroidetes bacterium]|nr:hypothetical protein [Bacteroidota bacterium]MBU1115281.1 hypothetical protein [Bacteroidota bacterium]MBU1800163.1 hypothetical protein [Bacteroidota bacterium]
MKNLMNVAIVLFTVALLTSTMFAQQGNGGKNIDSPKINWVDADGDGICDNVGSDLGGEKVFLGKLKGNGGTGLGDGSGIKPQDGSGFGKKTGDGICIDGTSALEKYTNQKIRN